ncbi:MAG: hypothetical protein ACP5R5_12165, partial [Armatimonadota bacterium]
RTQQWRQYEPAANTSQGADGLTVTLKEEQQLAGDRIHARPLLSHHPKPGLSRDIGLLSLFVVAARQSHITRQEKEGNLSMGLCPAAVNENGHYALHLRRYGC